VSRPVDFMACFLLRHLWELYRFLGIPSHTYTHLMSYHLYLYLTYICTHVATMRLIQLPLLLHLPRKIHPMNRSDIRFIYSLLVSILQLTTSIKTRSLPTENIPIHEKYIDRPAPMRPMHAKGCQCTTLAEPVENRQAFYACTSSFQ
jgi:hypothetical protein